MLKRLLSALSEKESSENEAFLPLCIAATGICCSLGHHAPAAIAAINANMNHFRETHFATGEGEPVIGAMLYALDLWGADRLRAMFLQALLECLAGLDASISHSDIAVLILAEEDNRPGVYHSWVRGILMPADEQAEKFHPSSRLIAEGKAGIGKAIHLAGELFRAQNNAPKVVIIAATDSYFTAATIEHFLSEERILTEKNSDGFIPGEGAAAIALTPSADSGGLWIEGCAMAQEEALPDGNKVMTAEGLTKAIREAVAQAHCEVADLDFYVTGVTGEAWCAKENELAMSRALERRAPSFPHEAITSNVGEIGAACAPLALAWLSDVMAREDNWLGKSALLHFANDDGARTAIVVKYRKKEN